MEHSFKANIHPLKTFLSLNGISNLNQPSVNDKIQYALSTS